jgi:hypothetical protein
MLMTTVAMVSVSHAGMNISSTFLENREGPHVRRANPSIIIVTSRRRRADDFFAPAAPCIPS